MRRRKLPFAFAVIIIVLIVASQILEQTPERTEVVVTRVIDGDTIVVEGGERVRLLDIDTPERGEACYTEATNRLKELVDGKEVVLESGDEDRDIYDRLLRYVFINGTLVNLVLVREGFANLYVTDTNTPYYPQLVEAEQAAKQEKGCVWK